MDAHRKTVQVWEADPRVKVGKFGAFLLGRKSQSVRGFLVADVPFVFDVERERPHKTEPWA